MKRFLFLMFCLLLLTGEFTVYAQGFPEGPPIYGQKVSDEPEEWGVVECDGYEVQVMINAADVEWFLWLDEEDEILYLVENVKEDGTLTNTVTGKSVNVMVRFSEEIDSEANTQTMTGIRMAIVHPGGEIEPVNAGHLVATYDAGVMKGEVISSSGRWDAVTDGVFDPFDYACQLVADD